MFHSKLLKLPEGSRIRDSTLEMLMPETGGFYGICHMLTTRGIHNDKLGIQLEIMGVSYGI
jgi:hypothetical protein